MGQMDIKMSYRLDEDVPVLCMCLYLRVLCASFSSVRCDPLWSSDPSWAEYEFKDPPLPFEQKVMIERVCFIAF